MSRRVDGMNSALPTTGPAFTDRWNVAHAGGGLAKNHGRLVTLFSLSRLSIIIKSEGHDYFLYDFSPIFTGRFVLLEPRYPKCRCSTQDSLFFPKILPDHDPRR
jgi:hypothetical protein